MALASGEFVAELPLELVGVNWPLIEWRLAPTMAAVEWRRVDIDGAWHGDRVAGTGRAFLASRA